MINALELMYLDILNFHEQVMKFFSGRRKLHLRWLILTLIVVISVWKRFFRSMWKDFNTKFGGILKNLSRHKDLVECRAGIAQYRRYQEEITDLNAMLDETIAREQTKKMMVVKDWLAAGEQQQKDNDSFAGVRNDCATTAQWILQHEIIKHWMDAGVPNTPTVWVHGIPGAGQLYIWSWSFCHPNTN
jgi:hypothetical protein